MPEPSSPPRRVLYAEDDRIAALLFAEVLRDPTEYELQVAETGAEALAIVREWLPDVLVLDANLPDTTGLALLADLRRQPGLEHTPAFVCSADALEADRRRHLQAGFRGYWLKPVNLERLKADLDAAASLARGNGGAA